MDIGDAYRDYVRAVNRQTVRRVKKTLTFAPSTAASLATSLTGTNNDMDITADTAGAAGNDITIEYRDPGLPSQSIGVSVTGTAIVVSLATNGGTNEVQTLTVKATGGTYILGFASLFTNPIAYNATAAQVKTALEGLPTIGAGNIDVSGSDGGPYTITFQGTLAATNVASLSVDYSNLTPHNPHIETLTTVPGDGTHNEVQKVRLQNAAVGTFTLTFNGQTTSALAYGASAATVQTAFLALSSVGSGNATVTKSGDEYTITFGGTLGNANQPQTTANASGLRPSAVVVQTTPGATYAITSTAANVKTAVDANTAAAALVNLANHSTDDGTGVVTVLAPTHLAGGTDAHGLTSALDNLFNVVGNCLASVTVHPQVTPVSSGGGTFIIGTVEDDNVFVASAVTATTAVKGIVVDKTGVVAAGTAPVTAPFAPLVDGDVIKLKTATGAITAGKFDVYCHYLPLDDTSVIRAA